MKIFFKNMKTIHISALRSSLLLSFTSQFSSAILFSSSSHLPVFLLDLLIVKVESSAVRNPTNKKSAGKGMFYLDGEDMVYNRGEVYFD